NSHSPQSLGLTLMLTQAHLQFIAANFNNIAGVNLPAFPGFYFAIHFYQTAVYGCFCFATTAKQALKFEYFIQLYRGFTQYYITHVRSLADYSANSVKLRWGLPTM